MLRRFVLMSLLTGLVSLTASTNGLAQGSKSSPIQPFVGKYVGQTVFASESGLTKRDLDVVITQEKSGFAIGWTTITQKPSGKMSRKNYIIAFEPTERRGLFKPVGDVQGAKLDPLKGDPRLWARIKGQTLSVYAVLITEDGGYEMQTYDRTLVPGGLDLNFTRVRDGNQLKQIRARLEVEEDKGLR